MNTAEATDTEATDYNGWSNHETWLASLWVGGTEAGYAALQRAYLAGDTTAEQAEWLEDAMLATRSPQSYDSSLWSDLLQTAFCQINWVEIIESNRE